MRRKYLPDEPLPPPIPQPPPQIFPPIPTRIICTGDTAKGRTLIGLGRTRLMQLQTALGFQGLPHGFNTLKFSDGSSIRASISFGLSKILIHVPEIGKEGMKPPEFSFCVCGCLTTTGSIVKITVDGKDITTLCEDSNEDYSNLQGAVYDVELCQKEESKHVYVLLENCFPSDFTRYRKGDYVSILWVPASGDPIYPDNYDDNIACDDFIENDDNNVGMVCPFKITKPGEDS